MTELLTPLESTQKLLDISVTERGQFRTCRRRWYLNTICNFEPKAAPGWALGFGTAIHESLQWYYSGATKNVALFHYPLDEWYAGINRYQVPEEELDEAHRLLELGHEMLDLYTEFDDTSPVQLGDVIAVEGKFVDWHQDWGKGLINLYRPGAEVVHQESGRLAVPIIDPNTTLPVLDKQGNQVYLTMRLDLITERKTPHKGLWITDHKTAITAPDDRGIDFDDQITAYCYGVLRWLGVFPRGVVYNILIKNAPKEPRELKNGSLSTAKDQLTTPKMYRKALREYGLMSGNHITSPKHAECYEALLARGWDPFFRRYEVMRNEDEIMNFERRLYEEYMDMRDSYASPDWVLNPGLHKRLYPNLSVFNCSRCPVNRICQAMEDGSDVDAVIEGQYQEKEDRKA